MRHDLLNNVTVIDGYNSLLISSEDDDKKLEWLKKMDISTKKLIELIESAASLVKLESTDGLELGSIDIGNMLCESIGNFEYQAGCKGSDINFVSEGTFVALANPVIEEVFFN
ncbi:hypothetical protein [Methanococcoides sp. FTZ1]|uniref:hypothetical protein n=1 Tax=Methanococcoides sp. FTZ1 TaxID=3439061 RepID=UPI003F8666BB